jgi:hypothetical protein
MTDQECNVNPPILNVCLHYRQIKWFYIFIGENSWSNENEIFVSDIKKWRIYHSKLGENSDSMIREGMFVAKAAISNSVEETNQLVLGSGFVEISDRNIRRFEYSYVLLFGKCNTFWISLN